MPETLTVSPWTLCVPAVMWFAAYMTGQGLANLWRPAWQILMYGLMLGLVDRFLVFALFEGPLLSLAGYLIDTAILLAVAGVGYRLTQTHRMVSQYPWLYERAGLFSWRARGDNT